MYKTILLAIQSQYDINLLAICVVEFNAISEIIFLGNIFYIIIKYLKETRFYIFIWENYKLFNNLQYKILIVLLYK